jgi:levanase/fructan beta-fructosidase
LYLDGVYHLYNQQNPYENKWGHMSWGHATSRDLVHWRHLPIALLESIGEDTTWRFSGSAVWDKDNTSGFCKKGGCIVAIYTADQPDVHKESQYVAYSNDGGMSLTDYTGNPVIDLHKRDFRDPNVFWYQPGGKWVMAVALPADHKVRFYGSPNLKQWTLLSEFGPQGFVGANWECPFLIQLGKKWVLANSAGGRERGPYMQYFVGEFDGTTFTNDNPADTELTLDYGDCFYAAIPWNGLPDDQKTFIGWMVPGTVATYPWRGQMSVPRDLALTETAKGLRLMQEPSRVFMENLVKESGGKPFTVKELVVDNKERVLDGAPKGNAYFLEAGVSVKGKGVVGFRLAGGAEIVYDAAAHDLYLERAGKPRRTIELPAGTDSVQLEVFLDKSSLEVFVNGGLYVLSTYLYPAEGADRVAVFAMGGAAVLRDVVIRDLSTIEQ